MIIYKIGNLWNFDNFPNCKVLRYFSKWNNFRKFGKFVEFYKLDVFRSFKIDNFWNFPNCTSLEFQKLTVFGIFQMGNFWNCTNWKIKKCVQFFIICNTKICLRNEQFWNCSSIRYSALIVILPILIFALSYKWIFSILFHFLVTREFGRSTFLFSNSKRQLKFDCLKF